MMKSFEQSKSRKWSNYTNKRSEESKISTTLSIHVMQKQRDVFKILSNIYGWVFHVRNSRPEVFRKKGVLKNFAKFTRKYLCQSLFFNKAAGLRPQTYNFIKKETLALWPCEFCKNSKMTTSVMWKLLKVLSCKLKKHGWMIAYVFQKCAESFAFQLFILLQ